MVHIRPAVSDESVSLVALGESTGVFNADEADTLLGDTLNNLHAGSLPHNHQAHVAISSEIDKPVGWVYFGPSDETTTSVWELFWIGVVPTGQKSGVGSALLSFVEKTVAESGARLLVVETSSAPMLQAARSFYAKHSYGQCGRIADGYGEGEDKIVFVKAFK